MDLMYDEVGSIYVLYVSVLDINIKLLDGQALYVTNNRVVRVSSG